MELAPILKQLQSQSRITYRPLYQEERTMSVKEIVKDMAATDEWPTVDDDVKGLLATLSRAKGVEETDKMAMLRAITEPLCRAVVGRM